MKIRNYKFWETNVNPITMTKIPSWQEEKYIMESRERSLIEQKRRNGFTTT